MLKKIGGEREKQRTLVLSIRSSISSLIKCIDRLREEHNIQTLDTTIYVTNADIFYTHTICIHMYITCYSIVLFFNYAYKMKKNNQ